MTEAVARCSTPDCAHVYGPNESPPCPLCAATDRAFELEPADEIPLLSSLKGVQGRVGFLGPIVEFWERVKLSRRGRLARESLRLDRSDPNKTVKTHHVDERQDDGSWDVVHDEREEYPAKRRPS